VPHVQPGDVNSGWNAALEYAAECFEKKAHRNEMGSCNYTTAAALIRSYRHDPNPPAEALRELQEHVYQLETRVAALEGGP